MKSLTVLVCVVCVLFASTSLHAQILENAEDGLFFADSISGGGWSVQIAVSNNSATRSLWGGLAFVVDRSVEGAAPLTGPEAFEQFTLPPNGTRIFKTSPDGPTIRGGVLLLQFSGFDPFESDTQMMSAVLTYRHQSGLEVSVPPIREEDLASPFFSVEPAYAVFVEHSENVSAGLALWGDPAGEVCMYLVDLEGNLVIDPDGYSHRCFGEKYGDTATHAALTLEEWFPSWDFSEGFQGRWIIYVRDNTFGRNNDGFLVPLALRFSRDLKSMSAMPVVPILSPVDY